MIGNIIYGQIYNVYTSGTNNILYKSKWCYIDYNVIVILTVQSYVIDMYQYWFNIMFCSINTMFHMAYTYYVYHLLRE